MSERHTIQISRGGVDHYAGNFGGMTLCGREFHCSPMRSCPVGSVATCKPCVRIDERERASTAPAPAPTARPATEIINIDIVDKGGNSE